jgi:ribosomal protein L18
MTAQALHLLAVAAMAGILSGAVPPSPSEYEIKAAFLYNFAKFVDWPTDALPDTSTSMSLCVLGEDHFGIDLDETLNGKQVNGRKLLIKRFKGVHGLDICQILFISSSEKHRLAQVIASLKNSSILTVSETEQFTQLGGIINFTIEENKVRFEINVDAAERAGLKISSRLLKVAKVIRGRGNSEQR